MVLTDRERSEALDTLVAMSRPQVYRIAVGYRRGEDAEDLCQVAMLALADAAPRYDPGRGRRWESYVHGVAHRAIRRHLSRQKARAEVSLDPQWGEDIPDEVDEEVQSLIGGLLLRDRLDSALAALPNREAETVRLRYGLAEDGRRHTLQEVAEHLGITSRAGALHVERQGLRKLRLALRDAEGQEDRRRRSGYRSIAARVRVSQTQRWLLRQVHLCGQDATTIAASGVMGLGECRAELRRIEDSIWAAIRAEGAEGLRELHRDANDVLICCRNASMRKSGGASRREDAGGAAGGVSSDDLIYEGVVAALLDS